MKKKLLVLCYRAPYPLRSGCEIRMFQFIEILSEFYEIDLLYVKEYPEDETSMRPLYEKCRTVKAYEISKPKRVLGAVAGYLFKNWPFQAGWFYSGALQKEVRRSVDDYRDILCMHVRMVSYLFSLPGEKLAGKHLYFDGIDAITMNYYNSYRTAKGLRKLMNLLEYRRMAEYERRAYELIKTSSLISERDRDYITKELKADCAPHVIYNYAIDYGYRPELEKDECTLAFMGKMNYAPNVDAVRHFCEKVYPVVKKRYPRLKLWIIGGFVTPEIKKLGELDGVVLTGFIENPSEYLQRATLVIAPMISGSGLQNKIVQAMYLGAAVVTTPIGADGLKDVTNRELVIVEDDREMAEKLCELLDVSREEERRRIGAAARAYIGENYGYEQIRERIVEMFTE